MPRILLAEDNAADVYLIRAALREHGVDFPLDVARDGGEVLRILEGPAPLAGGNLDLIILDLNLPRYGGLEILRLMRDTERLAEIPVVVLTSSDSPRDRAAATQMGAVRFLRKPSNLEQFLSLGAVFRDILGLTEAQSGGA